MLGCTDESHDVVSHSCREGGSRHDSEERKRENSHTSTNLGSFGRTLRNSMQSIPTCSTPQVMIVDFEGYEFDGNYFIKELAFYDPFGMYRWNTTFRSPFALISCKKRLTENIELQQFQSHGLTWESGQLPYSGQAHIVSSFASNYQLYAQNSEKTQILEQVSNCTITDLSFMNVPPVYELPFGSFCFYHDVTKFSCALDKAVRIGQYFLNLYSKQDPAV